MIYLIRADGQIEACEQETSARRCELRGFVRCAPKLYRAYWRRKDRRALAALAWQAALSAPLQTAPLSRAVGDAPGLPGGWKLYQT